MMSQETNFVRRFARNLILPTLAATVLAIGLLVPLVAHATTCPGYTPSVDYEAWLTNIKTIDAGGTVTNVQGDVSSATTINVTPGDLIRADLMICWDGTDVGEVDSSFAAIFKFHDHAAPKGTPPSQEDWNSHDRVHIENPNTPVMAGRFFQAMPPEPDGITKIDLTPQIKANDGDSGNNGPVLSAAKTGISHAPYLGSTPSDVSCGNPGGNEEAALAEDGNTSHAVGDDQIHKQVDTLHYDGTNHLIDVSLSTRPNLRAPLVGEPITIEDANPTAYNGTWTVSSHSTPTSTYCELSALLVGSPGDSSVGTVDRYYQSGNYIPEGAVLFGYIEVCGRLSGTNYYIPSIKFVGDSASSFKPWASMDAVISVAQGGLVDTKWYQTLPCEATTGLGKYINVQPRAIEGDTSSAAYGDLPEAVDTQGTAFRINLTATNARNDCA